MDKTKKMTEEKRTKFMTELGELTFERAQLSVKLNANTKRSNEIGTMIEESDNAK